MRKRSTFHWRRRALLAGASTAALLAADRFSPAFADSVKLSPASLEQAASQRAAQLRSLQTVTPLSNPAVQRQVALSAANLARAAQAIKNMQAAQLAATQGNGLVFNGEDLSGSSFDGTPLSGLNPLDDDPTKWIGADKLQKDIANKTATVKQTQPLALTTYQSFDLNTGETYIVDQKPTDVIYTRILAGAPDASGSRFVAAPSHIFGTIKAPGTMYVENPNGIIFGSSAQINVHSLIATSLGIGGPTMSEAERNTFFFNTGITNPNTPQVSFSYNANDKVVEGDVKVEAGAVIATDLAPRSVSPDAGGFVYLFAPNVENDGTILTPSGETMMVASQTVQLIPNAYPDGGVNPPKNASDTNTFRGVGYNSTLAADSPPGPWRLDGQGEISSPGTVVNKGMIDSERGIIILNGDNVTLAGILKADTSVTRNGMIFLDARLQLTLAADSHIQILPDENGETIPLSAVKDFDPGSIEMRGNTIDIESGALVLAPGGNVAVAGQLNPAIKILYPDQVHVDDLFHSVPRVFMAPDAAIDVAGLDGVTLPMAANLFTFKPFGNEFADSPLQRDGALRGQDITVDIRESGTFNGTPWVGTPLANVSDAIGNIQHGIDQLLTTGGTVNLSAANGEIVLRQGSTINVAGGYVQYEGGNVATTNLVTADGRIVNIANASPLDTYIGVAGVSTLEHPHWGPTTSETFVNPLLTGGHFEAGYVEGHDAGGITLNAKSTVADGTFVAGVIPGERQALLGKKPAAATANTNLADPTAMPSSGFLKLAGQANLVLQKNVDPVDTGFGDPLPGATDPNDPGDPADVHNRIDNTVLSADSLTDARFGSISANFTGSITVKPDASLEVAPGGSITLIGGSDKITVKDSDGTRVPSGDAATTHSVTTAGIDIEGSLIARSGSITIEETSLSLGDTGASPSFNPGGPDAAPVDLKIGAGALLDVSGQWVNDTGAGAETLIGGAYVDGGSIALKTDTQSTVCGKAACSALVGAGNKAVVDLTGNIVITEGSLLDVSSGGRITDRGAFQLDSKGRPVGKGGSVALQTYIGASGLTPPRLPPTTALPSSTVIFTGSDGTAEGNARALNAAISAYGLQQGGKLSIQAPAIVIGDAVPATPGAFALPADFFDGNAYGGYSLSSVVGGTVVAPGATVTLRQRNFVSTDLFGVASGAKIADIAGVDFLPDFIRAPVNLDLSATLPLVPVAPFDPNTSTAPPSVAAVVIGEGASIIGDKAAGGSLTADNVTGATITISVRGQPGAGPDTGGGQNQIGQIPGQEAVAEILGTIQAPSGAIKLSGGNQSEIWLGADSRLDVSGFAAIDSRETRFRSGAVLPGGLVSINASQAGSAFIAETGSVIDISGAAGEVDLLQDAGPGLVSQPRIATPIWSDAGAINVVALSFLDDGSIIANPGADAGNGGSLSVALAGTGHLIVHQTDDGVPAAPASPTDSFAGLGNNGYFQADRLEGSGIANLTLSASLQTGDDISSHRGQFAPGEIDFSGNVEIGGLNSLALDASIVNLTDVAAPATGACSANVCLSANYVALRGAGSAKPVAGTGALTVSANMIDIAAGGTNADRLALVLSGVADTKLISTGDIRLRVPLANAPQPTDLNKPATGVLLTSGDLTLQAAQIYPVSDVDVTLKSAGANGTITILGNGAAVPPPLSAGGAVTVDAVNIVQDGTLRAPLGTIRLGAQTASDLSPLDNTGLVVTQSVTLTSRSVTSVSLADLVVPFGETTNGGDWSYNSIGGVPLGTPPAKSVSISGANVEQAGATIDLSGGGDIQAMEFVRGTGGSRDVLANDPNVFAIIPGYNPAAAPIDFDLQFVQGDALPAVGRSVFLSGGPGLPAGYYTLLPAHYATLPGAYRVKLVANSQDALASQNVVMPDGTARMAGFFAQPGIGTRNARTVDFDVQSSAVWRQYSEIDQTSGNAFFGGQGAGSGAAPPRLPQDAGHVAFNAVAGLDLPILIDAAAPGGLGPEIDLATRDMQILSPGGAVRSGYFGFDATTLSGLAADSLLLGGVRISTAGGETIHAVANSIEISNDASAPLQGPEIILVTRAGQGAGDPNAARGLRADAGSVVEATGAPTAANGRTVTIGDSASGVRGQGSLIAVSTGGPILVDRQNVSGSTGLINILAGATFDAGTGGSLTIDTTGSLRAADSSVLAGRNIAIGSAAMTFGGVPGNPPGFNVSDAMLRQLKQAKNLTLSSRGAISFFGDTDITLAAQGSKLVVDADAIVARADHAAVTLAATGGTVELRSDGSGVQSFTPVNATLQVKGDDIELRAGDNKTLGGFANVDFVAAKEIAVRDSGSLDAGSADIAFQTPLFLVGAGAKQTITTTGAVAFGGSGTATQPSTPELGGTLAVNAGAISVDALDSDTSVILAAAGGVTLHATSADAAPDKVDILLGKNAKILAAGYAQKFFDVTRVAHGGVVQLISDSHNIEVDTGAVIDVSSASGFAGDAGTIALTAAKGRLSSKDGQGNLQAFDFGTIAGTLAGDSGGTLAVDAQGLGTMSLALPSIFSDTVDVRVRSGDLDVAAGLKAQNVTLTADAGTLSVDSTIDASGEKGGTISLFGGRGVTLGADGQLLATASDASKRGGDIVIGTETAAANGSASDGVIDLQHGRIDVSNTGNSGNGGTVRLRAPLTVSGDDVAIDTVTTPIAGAGNITVEAFKVYAVGSSGFTGDIDPVNQGNFYGSCTAAGDCTGELLEFVENFGLSGEAMNKFAAISPDILHVQPGIELVNDSGDINVKSNWNLGSGIYDPNTKTITKLFYRVGGSPTGEAATLTLRAAGDVNIGATITDGFFQTEDRLDPNYVKKLNAWITAVEAFAGPTTNVSIVGGRIQIGATGNNPIDDSGNPILDAKGNPIGPPPAAPYDPNANVISPIATSKADPTPIAGADLFPLVKDPNGPIQGFDGNYRAINSWSYRIVAGADTNSANPLAVKPLSVFADGTGAQGGHGNVVIDGHTEVKVPGLDLDTPGVSVTFEIPTMVRTGTGSIDIAAGRDFILKDTKAPGVVYTAGRNSTALPGADFQLQQVPDILQVNNGDPVTLPVAQNSDGFFAPQVLTCAIADSNGFSCNPYGPITAAAYPVAGGHLTVKVQQDILGFEHPTVASPGVGAQPNQQYFAPWLYAQGTPLSDTVAGAFAPLSAYISDGGFAVTPQQTSWWINFGTFDQGLMSVGGDVRIEAGRDISQLSVSLPTTASVSGGLSATVPQVNLNASGDLTVIAGRDILSGAYYEGSGAAEISAGGSVAANWSATDKGDLSGVSVPVSTVLAVDSGTLSLRARGNLDIAGVVSGASLQNVSDVLNGNSGVYISTYGKSSDVNVQAVSGNVAVNSLSDAVALVDNSVVVNNDGIADGFFGINAYPASFEAVSMRGDVNVADSLQLAPSDDGMLNLLAYGSVRTFTKSQKFTINQAESISTGPSLVQGTFDPARPLTSFGPDPGSSLLDNGTHLLHQNDHVPDRFYALTGDIVSGAGVPGSSPVDPTAAPLSWEVTKPAIVHAARDIVDLPFFGQNLSPEDVTQILAGRDIFYTGAWELTSTAVRPGDAPGAQPPSLFNAAGLSLAGPGFFDIEAGRNLGPFVTAVADITKNVRLTNLDNSQHSTTLDSIGTGIITFGNTVVAGNRLMTTDDGNSNIDPFGTGANFLLPAGGANIIALFGVGSTGPDYQAVIKAYIDPATSTSPRDYLPALAAYLQTLGRPAQSPSDAFATFESLPEQVQHPFIDQVVFNEMSITGKAGCCTSQFDIGYAAISTLFPATSGFTDNGANGAGPAQVVRTGNLEMLHATIKTQQSAQKTVELADGSESDVTVGGDITLFGPGGDINVGATAAEQNSHLTNSAIGILTLDGGAIGTFTDGSVLVNQSRILTVQGGDIVMWTSNGDLDAGRGKKTSVDFRPLTVQFDPQDLQTLNLTGLVSGAGIGTIQSTPDAPAAAATLIAPRGTVNAGDAGLRSSGNLQIAALRVLNAANIAVAGAVSGVPQVTQVNLGALESSSSSAGQAAKAAEQSAAAAANRGGQTEPRKLPSLITVEVLGFGECDPQSSASCN